MYIDIFIVGIIVQALFSVTPVTLGAAVALCSIDAVSRVFVRRPVFTDSIIPVQVFLGMHLLITDPVTSPRGRTGKIVFGGLNGAGVVLTHSVLTVLEAPVFYDKLLCVVPLNLLVPYLDRVFRVGEQRSTHFLARLNTTPNFAYMGVWIIVFTLMLLRGYVNA